MDLAKTLEDVLTEIIERKNELESTVLYLDTNKRGTYGVCDYTKGVEKFDDGDMYVASRPTRQTVEHPLGRDYISKMTRKEELRRLSVAEQKLLYDSTLSNT